MTTYTQKWKEKEDYQLLAGEELLFTGSSRGCDEIVCKLIRPGDTYVEISDCNTYTFDYTKFVIEEVKTWAFCHDYHWLGEWIRTVEERLSKMNNKEQLDKLLKELDTENPDIAALLENLQTLLGIFMAKGQVRAVQTMYLAEQAIKNRKDG